MSTPHPRHPLVPYSRPAPPPRMVSCEYACNWSGFGKETVKKNCRIEALLSPCPIRAGLCRLALHLPVCRVAPPARDPHGLGSSPAPVLGVRVGRDHRERCAPTRTEPWIAFVATLHVHLEQYQHRRAKWPALRRLAPARSWTRAATPPSRSRSASTTARSLARPSRPAPPPAPSRRPSVATETRAATWARGSSRPSMPSSRRSTRASSVSTPASSGSSTPR